MSVLKLHPVLGGSGSWVRLSGAMWMPPYRWQLREVVERLSERPVRIVLPARAPRDWLERWSDALAELGPHEATITFVLPAARRRRSQGF